MICDPQWRLTRANEPRDCHPDPQDPVFRGLRRRDLLLFFFGIR